MPKKHPKQKHDDARAAYEVALEFEASPADAIAEVADVVGIGSSTVYRAVAPPKPPSDSLTVAAVAGMLGVSPSQVRALVRQGAIDAERHGRAVRITRQALDAYRQSAACGVVKSGRKYLR